MASRALSYDFSKWTGVGGDRAAAPSPAIPIAEAPPSDEDVAAVSFRVYTPAEIQQRPMRRSPPPPPPPEDGLRDVQEAIALAKDLGPRALVARVGIGAFVAAVLLAAVGLVATLADDTPTPDAERAARGLVGPVAANATEPPASPPLGDAVLARAAGIPLHDEAPAPMPVEAAATIAAPPVEIVSHRTDDAAAGDETPYYELPASPAKHASAAPARPRAIPSPVAAAPKKKTVGIVRDSPY